MAFSKMSRKNCLILATFTLCVGTGSASNAASRQTFIIPQSDGYGIAECFSEGHDCARVVADAWCEAHGNARAIAYGRAEDTTSAIVTPASSDASAPRDIIPGSIIISCGE